MSDDGGARNQLASNVDCIADTFWLEDRPIYLRIDALAMHAEAMQVAQRLDPGCV